MARRESIHHAREQIRIVEAILRRWDPIGVEPGTMAPLDEYDGFAPHIVSLVIGGADERTLTEHLHELRTGTIGAASQPDRDEATAREIIDALRG